MNELTISLSLLAIINENTTPAITSQCSDFFLKKEDSMTSKEWIAAKGIKANQLDIYDVLEGLCFRHCDGIVDVLRPPNKELQMDGQEEESRTKWLQLHSKQQHPELKLVCSKLVNAKYCEAFAHVRWKDGKLRHVQISPEIVRSYEERMRAILTSIKRRIKWLRQGSRELFGSIVEDDVGFIYCPLHG
ncbi:hypothetical protein Ciccas_004509 [Cichlidogyrus casuarinus]|uniref:Uncharacterized protein n=1 Tax=Cichlidogyrus casuarinus TaxID=1844966 RepID=A0ABD2QBE2_9PLAT